ncbi:hypothetical protein BH11ARM2_BH11ARM2_20940 [soil metagenome]
MIYNDVIVRDMRGGVWIYGYPKEVFPPTDFHTATMFGDGSYEDVIFVIGGLGYPADREPWRTPVYRLRLSDLIMQPLDTKGEEPGWIFKHQASHTDGKIEIVGGEKIDVSGRTSENKDRYQLNLLTLEWKRIS